MEYKTCKVYDSEAPKVLHELSIAQVMCKNDLHESQSQAGKKTILNY